MSFLSVVLPRSSRHWCVWLFFRLFSAFPHRASKNYFCFKTLHNIILPCLPLLVTTVQAVLSLMFASVVQVEHCHSIPSILALWHPLQWSVCSNTSLSILQSCPLYQCISNAGTSTLITVNTGTGDRVMCYRVDSLELKPLWGQDLQLLSRLALTPPCLLYNG